MMFIIMLTFSVVLCILCVLVIIIFKFGFFPDYFIGGGVFFQ